MLAPIFLAGSHDALVPRRSHDRRHDLPALAAVLAARRDGHVVIGGDGLPKPDGYRVPPAWLSPLTHPLIALLVVPASLLWARLRGAAAASSVLVLLALLLLLRCMLDPWNTIYYALPFLLALLAWEALQRPDRPPVLALVATVLVWVTFQRAPQWLSPDMQCAFFLAWSLPLAAWLAREAFAPGAGCERAATSRSRARLNAAA